MHKSTTIGLFLIASLLVGTTANMQMFVSNAVAQEYGQYPNSYQQSALTLSVINTANTKPMRINMYVKQVHLKDFL